MPGIFMTINRSLRAGMGLLLLFVAFGARTATVLEDPELKAAFVFNFSLFTSWPKMSQSLRICVLGEDTFVPLLKKYEGRQVQGATVHVDHVLSPQEARSCQVLFIDASEYEHIAAITSELQGTPVLTVAEAGILDPRAVHIMLLQANGRMAFEVNQTSAAADGLNLSFKLLKLARKVY